MNNKHLAEINYLRTLKKITFKEIAAKIGYSAYWLRVKINSGDEKIIENVKKIISEHK